MLWLAVVVVVDVENGGTMLDGINVDTDGYIDGHMMYLPPFSTLDNP